MKELVIVCLIFFLLGFLSHLAISSILTKIRMKKLNKLGFGTIPGLSDKKFVLNSDLENITINDLKGVDNK